MRHRDGAECTLLTALPGGAASVALAELLLAAGIEQVFADSGHVLDFISGPLADRGELCSARNAMLLGRPIGPRCSAGGPRRHAHQHRRAGKPCGAAGCAAARGSRTTRRSCRAWCACPPGVRRAKLHSCSPNSLASWERSNSCIPESMPAASSPRSTQLFTCRHRRQVDAAFGEVQSVPAGA